MPAYATAAPPSAQTTPAAGLTKRQRLDRRFSAMWSDMTPMRTQWDAILRAVTGRSLASIQSTPRPWSQGNILNNCAGRAYRTWRSGSIAGLMPSTQEWFELTTTIHELDQLQDVRVWRASARDRMLAAMDRSNFYAEAEGVCGYLGLLGTAAMSIEEDAETSIRCETYANGAYAITHDSRRRVNAIAREWLWSAEQIAGEFGKDQCSEQVRKALDEKNETAKFLVRHMVYPNDGYSAGASDVDATRKKFSECYWEPSTPTDAVDRFLREGGFDSFPFAVPRWGPLDPNNWYGVDYPGAMAHGDIQMLQEMERQGLNGLRKEVSPPTTSGPAWKNKQLYVVPGAHNVEDGTQGDPTVRAIYQVNMLAALDKLEAKIQRVEGRIEDAFYVPYLAPLLMRLMQQNEQPTAAQAYMVKDEQYGMLGPVIERVNDDFVDPCIDRIFGIMWRRGEIPPPPPAMRGAPLRVRLKSRMADAQKSVGVSNIERHMQFLTAMVAAAPQLAPVLDTFDADEAARIHAESQGVPPTVTRDEDATEALRATRAQAQQQAQVAEAAPQIAGAAKALGDTDMTKDSALTRLVGAATR